MKRIATLLAAVAILLMAPSAALAQSSTCQAYNPQLCSSVSSGEETSSSATLPFTGIDVTLLVVGGAGLLGAGIVVRRLSRNLS
jgi:hypothetical protein